MKRNRPRAGCRRVVGYPRPIVGLGALVHQRTTLTVIPRKATSRAVALVRRRSPDGERAPTPDPAGRGGPTGVGRL